MAMREVCEELDSTLLELMDALSQLSRLRNRYGEDIKEVGVIKKCMPGT